MVPRRYIDEWKRFAMWQEDAQVEQDLVIEKILLELFNDSFIQQRLAFRGGTALHKLYLKPQVRYSEDIDLVQIKAEPIKDTIDTIRRRLAFLGKPVVKQKANNNTLLYRFISEVPPLINLRLKIEINCREHFSVFGYRIMDYHVENSWTDGSCQLTVFDVEEMLGTKLRALYQRKKGRDLFDLYYALANLVLNPDAILKSYEEYMRFSVRKPPTQKQFLINMEDKLREPDFEGDIFALLRPGISYNQGEAYELIKSKLIEKM
jgi:predicted nucleotidyltransferase component of viral defense system